MPSIGKILADAPKPKSDSEWTDERVYRSPDGSRDAVFYEPHEFHMGSYSWKLKIILTESGQTEAHEELSSFEIDKHLNHPLRYVPWSGTTLLLTNWKPTCRLYNVATQSVNDVSQEGFATSAIGSPHTTRFLLTAGKRAALVDGAGKEGSRIDISWPDDEYPEFHWLKSADCFFSVHRANSTSAPCITFFDGESAAILESFELDPFELVPYEAAAYGVIPRDRFSLVIDTSTRCVGYFLDVWSCVVFNEDTNLLSLRVYRPASTIHEYEGVAMCNVEERWIEVSLNP